MAKVKVALFAKNASWCLLLQAILLIGFTKNVSPATFHIIGLTKVTRVEFLSLDWIYRSIRMMTVDKEKGSFTTLRTKLVRHLHVIIFQNKSTL